MPASNFAERLPQNTPGKYYVDEQCLDCDLCRETAPTVFGRDEAEGVSFVAKQPVTKGELEQVQEALEGCPCEAIFSDGDQFDWSEPRNPSRPEWREGDAPKPVCEHCSPKKPWWKFWR